MADEKFLFNRGVRWGRLLASLQLAKQALAEASHHNDVLDSKDLDMLVDITGRLIGIEQRAWLAQDTASKKLK